MMMEANMNNICWIFCRVKEWFMRYNNEVFVKYRIDKDSIVFWTSDINENISAAKVLNEFLYDFSKGKIINDPFNIFLRLSDAKININHFDCACESMIYYFDNKVNWTDFLATSIISQPQKYIKEGILIAYFASVDQGADYWFECSKDYKENVLILLRTLTALGCRVKQVSHLSFPFN